MNILSNDTAIIQNAFMYEITHEEIWLRAYSSGSDKNHKWLYSTIKNTLDKMGSIP